MDVADGVKMQALKQVLLYFGFRNIEIWNLYFCNSFLFQLKPIISRVTQVFPSLSSSYCIRIRKEYCDTIIVL